VPKRRILAFFSSLYSSLKRGGRAVFQFYPENVQQLELLTSAAMTAGFSGGLVVDYPHSTKAKKNISVLICRDIQSNATIGHRCWCYRWFWGENWNLFCGKKYRTRRTKPEEREAGACQKQELGPTKEREAEKAGQRCPSRLSIYRKKETALVEAQFLFYLCLTHHSTRVDYVVHSSSCIVRWGAFVLSIEMESLDSLCWWFYFVYVSEQRMKKDIYFLSETASGTLSIPVCNMVPPPPNPTPFGPHFFAWQALQYTCPSWSAHVVLSRVLLHSVQVKHLRCHSLPIPRHFSAA